MSADQEGIPTPEEIARVEEYQRYTQAAKELAIAQEVARKRQNNLTFLRSVLEGNLVTEVEAGPTPYPGEYDHLTLVLAGGTRVEVRVDDGERVIVVSVEDPT